jgi:hypothetical protein
MKKTELLEKLNHQLPCLFTIEQVKNMIDSLEDQPTNNSSSSIVLSEEFLESIGKQIEKCIEREIDGIDEDDIVSADDIDLSLYDRTIEINHLNLRKDAIYESVTEGIRVWRNNMLESQQTQN